MTNERISYTVYVKTNADGYITAVNSSAFLSDATGWVKIDSGYGGKYGHAQSSYFQKPITTDSDVHRYKLVNGKPTECSAEEIAIQEEALKPQTLPSESTIWDELDAAYQSGINSI